MKKRKEEPDEQRRSKSQQSVLGLAAFPVSNPFLSLAASTFHATSLQLYKMFLPSRCSWFERFLLLAASQGTLT